MFRNNKEIPLDVKEYLLKVKEIKERSEDNKS